MSEEDEGEVWGDEGTEGEATGDNWDENFRFDDSEGGDTWEDSQGTLHELHFGDPDIEGSELRTGFDTFEEARAYIDKILTGADQFFDVFYDAEDGLFEVYYMGGSE